MSDDERPHVIRYRGERLSLHPTRAAALEHARTHHGLRSSQEQRSDEHHVHDVDNLTVEPEGDFPIYCRGNLVDAYRTEQGAREAIKRLARAGDEEAWTVGAP